MELKDLKGKHMLSGVDFGEYVTKDIAVVDEISNVIHFRLDGITYSAFEDPNDGYRSCMKELSVSHTDIKNTFHQVEVLGIHKTKDSFGCGSDIIEFIDTETAKPVLRVGTSAVKDFYPSYVAWFCPENMVINE